MSELSVCEPTPPPFVFPSIGDGIARIAATTDIKEGKLLWGQISLVQEVLRQRGESFDRQQDAAELKLRAERRLGVLLSERTTAGRWLRDATTGQVRGSQKTLPEGVNKYQGQRWRDIAEIPDEVFERHITETRAAGEELTQKECLELAQPYIQRRKKGLQPNIDRDGDTLSDDIEEAIDDDSSSEQDDEADYTTHFIAHPTVAQRQQLLADFSVVATRLGLIDRTSTLLACARLARQVVEEQS